MYKCNMSQIGNFYFKLVRERAGNNLSFTGFMGLYQYKKTIFYNIQSLHLHNIAKHITTTWNNAKMSVNAIYQHQTEVYSRGKAPNFMLSWRHCFKGILIVLLCFDVVTFNLHFGLKLPLVSKRLQSLFWPRQFKLLLRNLTV